MKKLNSSVVRCFFAIAVGLILVIWPAAAVSYLVIAIGICFVLPGIFSLLNYFTRTPKEGEEKPMFPIDGAGSVILGAWMVISPQFFVNIFMYVLGILLIVAGIQQIVSLSYARKYNHVPGGFYVIPIILLIIGAVILFRPFDVAANTFILFGIASLIYGITELVNWYKCNTKK